MAVCDFIEEELETIRRRGETPIEIRIGAYIWDEYKNEIRGTPLMPSDGEPTSYNGIPLSKGGQDPDTVYIDSE